MSVVKKLKVAVYVLKILTSLLLNRPFGNILIRGHFQQLFYNLTAGAA